MSSQSVQSTDSYKTNIINRDEVKYDDLSHMVAEKMPNEPGFRDIDVEKKKKKKKKKEGKKEGEYKEGQKVMYQGQQYDIIVILDQKMMLQNDYGTMYVNNTDFHKLSKC